MLHEPQRRCSGGGGGGSRSSCDSGGSSGSRSSNRVCSVTQPPRCRREASLSHTLLAWQWRAQAWRCVTARRNRPCPGACQALLRPAWGWRGGWRNEGASMASMWPGCATWVPGSAQAGAQNTAAALRQATPDSSREHAAAGSSGVQAAAEHTQQQSSRALASLRRFSLSVRVRPRTPAAASRCATSAAMPPASCMVCACVSVCVCVYVCVCVCVGVVVVGGATSSVHAALLTRPTPRT